MYKTPSSRLQIIKPLFQAVLAPIQTYLTGPAL